MTRAGALRHVLVIQQPVESRDVYGGAMVASWQDVATVRGQVVPVSGREYFSASRDVGESTVRLMLRHPGVEVTAKHRVLVNSVVHDIRAVLPDNRGRELTIICERAG